MRVLAVSFVLLATSVYGEIKSDWERENEDRLKQSEERVVPPPPLQRGRLVELKQHALADTEFRYYVDWSSVSAEPDRIVRYVLVARSPAGTENVTFEGIRCPREYRVYAVGRPEGGWGGRPSEWRPIPRNPNAAQVVLARHYFCPGRQPIATSAEGQRAVRDGGHPGAFPEAR